VWVWAWVLSGCFGSGPGEPVGEQPAAQPVVSADAPLGPGLPGRCEGEGQRDCFVPIPAGSFWMGAQASDPSGPGYDPAALPEEGPVRKVEVPPFQMLRTEASVALFERCVRAGACEVGSVSTGGYSNYGVPAREAHAINGITWQGARALCGWMGGRLPSELEWEYAARGPESRRYPWGDAPGCALRAAAGAPGAASEEVPIPAGCERVAGLLPSSLDEQQTGALMERLRAAWSAEALGALCAELSGVDDGAVIPAFVARVQAGPAEPKQAAAPLDCAQQGTANPADLRIDGAFGLLGMAGNVAEWVEGAFGVEGEPPPGALRVQRGGSWLSSDPVELRSASRGAMPPDVQLNDVGVRCVREGS
jgi:formylglycine-generating enzyme required for sulfatase activity